MLNYNGAVKIQWAHHLIFLFLLFAEINYTWLSILFLILHIQYFETQIYPQFTYITYITYITHIWLRQRVKNTTYFTLYLANSLSKCNTEVNAGSEIKVLYNAKFYSTSLIFECADFFPFMEKCPDSRGHILSHFVKNFETGNTLRF